VVILETDEVVVLRVNALASVKALESYYKSVMLHYWSDGNAFCDHF